MAITKAQLISDCELSLYAGTISDDAAVEKDQLSFWISYHLNNLVATECNEKLKRGESIPAIYQVRAALEIPELEALDDVDESDERIYCEMDNEILTLNSDMGLITVLDEEGEEIKKAGIQTLQLFKHMRFGKPTLENPLYYRQGLKIFLLGFKPVDIPFSLIQVFYVPKQSLLDMDDDEEVLCSDLVLPELIARVTQEGKLMLYGTQADQANNGVDDSKPVYHQQIKSPQ